MKLTIIVDVESKPEAYQIVNRLRFWHTKVLSAVFNKKTYAFDDKVESKTIKHFLHDDFGKKIK